MFDPTRAPREGVKAPDIFFVTVADPGTADATVLFPGQTQATPVRYKYAIRGMILRAGDTCYAVRISGTFVLIGGAVSGGGEPGATFFPAVSSEGVISWTNDGGLPNPSPVNIKGPQGNDGGPGPTGPQGPQGPKGDGMYAFEIRSDGHLWCLYDTAAAPAFSINAAGHLIYTIGA